MLNRFVDTGKPTRQRQTRGDRTNDSFYPLASCLLSSFSSFHITCVACYEIENEHNVSQSSSERDGSHMSQKNLVIYPALYGVSNISHPSSKYTIPLLTQAIYGNFVSFKAK